MPVVPPVPPTSAADPAAAAGSSRWPLPAGLRATGLVAAFCLAWQPLSAAAVPAAADERQTAGVAAAAEDSFGVAPQLDRYALTEGPSAGAKARSSAALRGADSPVAAISERVPVHGYGTLGVTWTGSVPRGLTVEVRVREDGRWATWRAVETSDDGPDEAEAAGARKGTEPVLVGRVQRAQVRVTSRDGSLPAGARLDVIDPGTTPAASTPAAAVAPAPEAASAMASAPAAMAVPAQPRIRSRAQWGADESLRSGSPSYGEVDGGVIHHTVNSNDYSRADVPAMLRGIYAYHVRSNGWSDVGYNYLIDRFGRIWEGRYGGITRPVIGAHAYGFNHVSFGASAIGNFEDVRAPQPMVDAYAELYAWRLALAGVPADGHVTLAGKPTQAIVGHRDVGSTACPGRNLYARLDDIRRMAAALQRGATPDPQPEPEPEPVVRRTPLKHDLTGDGRPDAVLGRGGTLTVLRGEGAPGFRRSAWTSGGSSTDLTVSGGVDLTGDGSGDLLVRGGDGSLSVRPGNGQGGLEPAVWTTHRFDDARTLDSIADVTGDGNADLVARLVDGSVRLSRGHGDGTFGPWYAWHDRSWSLYQHVVPAGDVGGDGVADVLLVDAGRAWLAAGHVAADGSTTYATPVQVAQDWAGDRVVAGADVTGDALADVVVTLAATQRTFVRPGQSDGTLGPRIGGWGGWSTKRSVALLDDVSGDDVADVLMVRRAGGLTSLPGRGTAWATPDVVAADSWEHARSAQVVGDWNGDGLGDAVTVRERRLWVHRGTGDGLGVRMGGWLGWGGLDLVTAVGDWTGDDRPDLVARRQSGDLWLYPGRGDQGVGTGHVIATSLSADLVADAGRWTGDKLPDLIIRKPDGRLLLRPALADGRLGPSEVLATDMSRYDRITGVGDWTGDGRPDLLAHSETSGRLHLLPGRRTGFEPGIILPLSPASADNLG